MPVMIAGLLLLVYGCHMENEVWLKSPSFPNYDVSNMGNVRRNKDGNGMAEAGRLLKQVTDRYGYKVVNPSRDGRGRSTAVHKLVCEAFHGPQPGGHQVAHGDGNRANNAAGNLRWATPLDNQRDRVQHGTSTWGGFRGRGHKLTVEQAAEIKALEGVRPSQHVADEYGVSRRLVRRIWDNQTWEYV